MLNRHTTTDRMLIRRQHPPTPALKVLAAKKQESAQQ
jgi:hypothetical protein